MLRKSFGGIGHLITEWDVDYYGKPIGYPVPEQQVQDWFLNDVQVAIQDCQTIFSAFDKLPEEIQHVLINMSFQLGRPRLSKFKKMIAAVEARKTIKKWQIRWKTHVGTNRQLTEHNVL